MRSKIVALLVVAVAIVAVGCGRSSSDNSSSSSSPGITSKQITLGGSYPFSGPASAYRTIAEGAKAYFDMVNAKGGVNGRKIKFVTLDDAYEPPRAVQNSRKLIQQDKVFALFNTLGTANNAAIMKSVNQQKVPQLFVATGASIFGSNVKQFPYTTGWQPDYVTEAKVYVNYLKKVKPNAKVAVLYQNDEFGKDLLGGFTSAAQGSNIKVVAKQSYEVTDPTVSSQMAKLKSSGADTFLNITTPKFSAQAIVAAAKLGWHPLHILNNVGASKQLVLQPAGLKNAQGIVSTTYFKDPEDPKWANDPAMKEYKAGLKKYQPRADPLDPFHVYGWGAAETMTDALRRMKKPTRAALMQAVRSTNQNVGILLPGINVKLDGTSDGFPIEAMQIEKFQGQNWKLQGKVVQAPH
jgi:branched-chain amino acid transport system substrate-binding protein